MSNKKPVIFISHIAEEGEIAIRLKNLIEKSFLNGVDVFVSSDSHSSGVGDGWLTLIKENLSESIYAIIICSPKSIGRPWINFEAGAAWIKNIKLAPLCHSGISPNELPLPLSTFNGTLLSNENGLENLFLSISKMVNLGQPNVNFSDFVNFISDFQIKYLFSDKLNEVLNGLESLSPGIINRLLQGEECVTLIPQNKDDFFSDAFKFLGQNRIVTAQLIMANVSMVQISDAGMSRSPQSSRYVIRKDINFIKTLLACGLIKR